MKGLSQRDIDALVRKRKLPLLVRAVKYLLVAFGALASGCSHGSLGVTCDVDSLKIHQCSQLPKLLNAFHSTQLRF